ncbi:hypothetical protein FB45DRAFT_1022815 [Roridomyces roridus]|uniref:Protein kinase domain-containing protein n=1 Tax=Roridomyces roridus TaxID=1738132 RepID=A0AAD7FTQ2_9AGAR|nr:hypothetical protein FB45DRAFT_1022815 [Roridomyces roridus]
MSRKTSKAPRIGTININGGLGGSGGRGDPGREGGLGQGPRVNFYDIRTQSVGICQEIYPGAFVPDPKDTTVNGENLTSYIQIQQQALPASEDDFRRIRWGDIRLLKEFCLGEPHVVRLHKSRNIARRILSSKVHPTESEKAVVVYNGRNAEEERQKYVERHSKFWHPNILQIFGLSSYSGLYAAVTHEDMMPYLEFLAVHRPSPVMTVYLHACWRLDFDSVLAYNLSDVVVGNPDELDSALLRTSLY